MITFTRAGCAAIFFMAMLIIPSHSNDEIGTVVLDKSQFGCSRYDDLNRILTLALSGDRQAMNQFKREKHHTRACVDLYSGRIHFIEETRGKSAFCIRPKGSSKCYWTLRR